MLLFIFERIHYMCAEQVTKRKDTKKKYRKPFSTNRQIIEKLKNQEKKKKKEKKNADKNEEHN